MLRQRSDGSSNSRKWNFLHAIFECQIGTVKIDFAKLALKLGYKNERCAQDMYHRFRRAHFPERRGVNNRGNINRTARHVHGKQQFHANGKMIHRKGVGFYRDDEEDLYHNNDDDEDDDDDDNGSGEDRDGEEERPGAGVKVEDADMERAEKDFWGLGIIDLEEWRCGEDGKIKMEPGIKKEPVVEEWVWT